jgi:hypothetical protein
MEAWLRGLRRSTANRAGVTPTQVQILPFPLVLRHRHGRYRPTGGHPASKPGGGGKPRAFNSSTFRKDDRGFDTLRTRCARRVHPRPVHPGSEPRVGGRPSCRCGRTARPTPAKRVTGVRLPASTLVHPESPSGCRVGPSRFRSSGVEHPLVTRKVEGSKPFGIAAA